MARGACLRGESLKVFWRGEKGRERRGGGRERKETEKKSQRGKRQQKATGRTGGGDDGDLGVELLVL